MLSEIIDRVGGYGIQFRDPDFETLVKSIVYQQLSGRVASVIFGRLAKAVGGRLTPQNILKLRPARMRTLGLSKQKTAYIRDLAHDLGVLQRYLVSPAPRSALVLGKALSAGVRALSQVLIVYVLALLLGVGISLNPLGILGVAAAIVLGSALFSTLSLIIACIVKTRERFMGIGQVLTMPIFFASNAIYPLSLMPPWLRAVSHVNPLTYEVDALRALMLANGTSDYGLPLDFGVLLAATAVLTAIAARMYGRMGY